MISQYFEIILDVVKRNLDMSSIISFFHYILDSINNASRTFSRDSSFFFTILRINVIKNAISSAENSPSSRYSLNILINVNLFGSSSGICSSYDSVNGIAINCLISLNVCSTFGGMMIVFLICPLKKNETEVNIYYYYLYFYYCLVLNFECRKV